MTSMPRPEVEGFDRVTIVGTGLIGTSIGMAAARAGVEVLGWDTDPAVLAAAAATGAMQAGESFEHAVAHADLVVVATPIDTVAGAVADALDLAPDAVVTDAASVKGSVVSEIASLVRDRSQLARFVPGHPMGGSERSGPEHAAASVVDGIVWVVAPTERSDPASIAALEAWIERIGARPVRIDPGRHDRLVAIVSHLPQVASTSLMGVAATEEADEPDILLLAAGGFRDLTRLAASQPALWSDILVANREQVATAIDAFVVGLQRLRDRILDDDRAAVETTFEQAKTARLGLAAKPTVRAGVAVWQVEIPDEPGALARITAVMGDGHVNIEDLQIVHSPEGGRGTVHLTVGAETAEGTAEVLRGAGYDPIRLA
jgi:prephenate dehydrogenase